MKNFSTALSRLSVVLAGALALGACSRAQYATLPRSTPYLGSTPVAAAPRPSAPVAAALLAQVATPVPAVKQAELPATATPLTTEAVVVTKAAPAAPQATHAPIAPQAALAPLADATPKLTLVQRLALHKVTNKLNKLAANTPQLKQRSASASTTRGGLDERLRTALLLTVVSIIVAILGSVVGSNFIGFIAGVVFVVALVFVLLYLIDQV